MIGDRVCTNLDPHLHHCPRAVVVFEGTVLVLEGQIVGLFPTLAGPVADRVVQLLERHGLADVPTTIEEAHP